MLPNFKTYLSEKSDLTESAVDEILKEIRVETIQKGEFLLRAGKICKHAFFTEKGLLRAFTADESGKEHIIQFSPENWLTSDRSSMYFNEPSDLFIEAIENSTVVFMGDEFMDMVSGMSHKFQQANDRALQSHIRQLQQRINQLLGATAEERYLTFIQKYPDLLLRVPLWMIASYLGITPESLSRVRKDLAKRNFTT
ncbi:Crp/Fnr family transcriptional regulator [Algoriphagus sp. C2-6-M1]|uniref:Crp/Fnr family transcriptional regulator n=1 Tax=Algoriphagus persicinus TaxID=3108754 RepID=UPI002B3BB034|nr:Crp/Fnr family transcriptional regulator [Algoriphagus sp. C2-6-M1]MEB2779847.1 Crp/Fnr family transcriptional regulator [Algoriphagus sp. C2-6-M1]